MMSSPVLDHRRQCNYRVNIKPNCQLLCAAPLPGGAALPLAGARGSRSGAASDAERPQCASLALSCRIGENQHRIGLAALTEAADAA